MKYAIAGGAVVMFLLALVSTGDAQGKKKDTPEVPPRAEEMPKYIKMLSSGNSKDRAIGAEKVGLRGMVNAKDVETAIETLKKMLEKDSDADARRAAARALGNIQPDAEETVPLLTKTVKDDKVINVRVAATISLGQYGSEAKSALPTLRDFAAEINNKKSQDFQTIQQAIKSISGKKK